MTKRRLGAKNIHVVAFTDSVSSYYYVYEINTSGDYFDYVYITLNLDTLNYRLNKIEKEHSVKFSIKLENDDSIIYDKCKYVLGMATHSIYKEPQFLEIAKIYTYYQMKGGSYIKPEDIKKIESLYQELKTLRRSTVSNTN